MEHADSLDRLAHPIELDPQRYRHGAYDIDTTDCCTLGIRAQQNGYDQATIAALDGDLVHMMPLLQKVN